MNYEAYQTGEREMLIAYPHDEHLFIGSYVVETPVQFKPADTRLYDLAAKILIFGLVGFVLGMCFMAFVEAL